MKTMGNIIDLNQISKAYLQKFKSCEIANQVLRIIIEQGVNNKIFTKQDIEKFKTEKGRNTSTFMLTYPLLSLVTHDKKGYRRYYPEPIMCYGETLYLSGQWGPDVERKDNLINWIINWVTLHGAVKIKTTNKIIPTIFKGEELQPCLSIKHGKDEERYPIIYDKNVHSDEQVPHLCASLIERYYRIIHFARNIFGEFLTDLSDIPVVLKKECPSKIYINSDEYVTKKINELVKSNKTITVSETSKLLRYEDKVLGEFVTDKKGNDGEQPYIVIYFNQFNSDNWNDYIDKIVKTLAHEYAHYCEYLYCKIHNKKSYQDNRVSEAIADFFGVLYSIDYGNLQIAEERYIKWVERFGSGWPYAYALYFYNIKNKKFPFINNISDYYHNGIIEKFLQVFEATLDAKVALKKLIN